MAADCFQQLCLHIQIAYSDAYSYLIQMVHSYAFGIFRWQMTYPYVRSIFIFRWHIQIYMHINVAYSNFIFKCHIQMAH